MKTFKKLVTTVCFIALIANSNAQTWTSGTNGFSLTPTTANLGIGVAASSDMKLRLDNNQAATNNLFGLYSFTTNSHTTSTSGTYGIHTNVASQNMGITFGHYVDANNTNTSSTSSITGIRTTVKAVSDFSPVFGVSTTISGPGKQTGILSTVSNTSTTTSSTNIGVQTTVTSQNMGLTYGHYMDVNNTNAASTEGTYGIRSSVNSSSNASTLYGIYSAVSGGNKRWAGYFTGGDMYVSGNIGISTTNPQAKLQVNAEGDPANIETNSNNGFMIRGNSQAMYMGVNSASNISYIQSVHWGTKVAPLLLNARGGNVGIGTMNPQYRLDVNGTIRAREVLVNIEFGADFVFEENYTLRPLDEVHNFIQTNKHLPEIPSAAEMVSNGLDMGEFQIKLLQKIEELTLYVIELNKKIEILENK